MTDRELLALAAIVGIDGAPKHLGVGVLDWVRDCRGLWNPLEDDGDALRLAVKLTLLVDVGYSIVRVRGHGENEILESSTSDLCAATRRAIVRAAAALASESPSP